MKLTKLNVKPLLLTFLLVHGTSFAQIQSSLTIEGAVIGQSRNEVRIPRSTGTEFSLSQLDRGPFWGGRVYAGLKFGDHHEFRALWAPLSVEVQGQLSDDVRFDDGNFAADTDTKGVYKFNSYRLTYRYLWPDLGPWSLAAGFTAKIRDANISLQQGSTRANRSNVGFVPLLHFSSAVRLTPILFFDFDLDAAAAPQGRAIDAVLLLRHQIWPGTSFSLGYRTVEGGADTKSGNVYNFAWIHYGVAQITYKHDWL
jgi:hypothetical protein